MKKFYSLVLSALLAALLTACATSSREAPVAYDLGPLRAVRAALPSGTPPLLLSDVHAPEWLEETAMHYRLTYVSLHESRSYANSRWSMPPVKLVEQRFKARLAASGGIVLPANNGVPSGIMLRLELDDFSQRFDSADKSAAQVVLRVSAFRDNSLLGQKTFVRTAPATSADAAGGAKALAVATDELIDDVLIWLTSLSANG